MPGGDGTGPAGMGPMTGRAAGYCAGYPVPGYMNPIPGRGYWGWGAWGGRGRRNWYYATGMPGWARAAQGLPAWGTTPYPAAPLTPYAGPYAPPMTQEQELEALKRQAEYFQNALGDIQKRMQELEAESEKAK